MVTVCHRYASSAEPETFTRSWRQNCRTFFGTEDTILYAACFDANGGVFEPLLTEEDAIISDALNHASIIDGVASVRLCATAMQMPTWKILKTAYSGSGSEIQTYCYRRCLLNGRKRSTA
jgi:hypothetical protein